MKKLLCLAVVLLLGAPQTSQAVGSFSLSTSDLLTATSMTSASSVAKLSGLTFDTVTVGTVSLALELEEIGNSLQSPHHNVTTITGGVTNSGAINSNGPLVTVQQTAGGANVTVSLNSIIAGGAGLGGTSAPTVTPGSNDPTFLLSLVANPSFVTLNSFKLAQALLIREAFNGFIAGTASATNAIAMDILEVGVTEFSPHHNAGSAASAANTLGATGNSGLVTIQQTAGFANVQAAVNQMIVGSGSISTTGISF
jgi:hypothetical protein